MSKKLTPAAAAAAEARLDKKIDCIAEMCAACTQVTVLSRYAIAKEVAALYNKHKGSRELSYSKLSERLGWSYGRVLDYVYVVKAWPDKAVFKRMSLRRNAKGRAIAWATFVQLAYVSGDARRAEFYKGVMEESWAYSRLLREIRESNRRKHPDRELGSLRYRRQVLSDLRAQLAPGLRKNASAASRKRVKEALDLFIEKSSFRVVEQLLVDWEQPARKVA